MFLLDVPRQPHCGEVSPAQLSNDMVFPVEKVSYLHMVIATWGIERSRGGLKTLTLQRRSSGWRLRRERREAYPCSSRWDLPAPRRQNPESPPLAPVVRPLAAAGAGFWDERAACETHIERAGH